MADSTEGDANVLYLGLLGPAMTALIFGLVIHSFIIGVNVNDWWKGRSVTPVDHIVTSLGISRMCAQCAITIYLFVSRLSLSSPDSDVTLIITDLVYVFFTFANVRLTSLLSIVFCLKISNLNTRLFLYLRRVIVQRTVYFIVAAVLLSALNILITFFSAFTVTKGGTYNKTMDNICMGYTNINHVYNYAIGDFFPLLFYYSSSVLLFFSLYHHTTKMKMSSNLSINLETYYTAMKFVFFTFIYNTLYYIGHIVYIFFSYFYCMNLEWLHIVIDFLPVVHSSYLIYRTAKLRNQMSKVLHNVIDLLIQRKDTETRGDIEIAVIGK